MVVSKSAIGQLRKATVPGYDVTPYTLYSAGLIARTGHFVIRGVAQQSGRAERLCEPGSSQRRCLLWPRSPWRLPPKAVRSGQASHQSALLREAPPGLALLVGAERAPIFDLPVPGLQIGIVYSVDGAKPVGIAKDYLPGGGSWSSPWKSQIAPAIAAASGITIKTLRMSVFVSNLVCKNYTCNYLKD